MIQKLLSIDYLRAIFAVAVVLWHGNGLALLLKIHPIIVNIIYYNFCLLAVPIFFQISLFLFYNKQITDSNYFLSKRLPKIIFIYIVWTLIGIITNLCVEKEKYLYQIANVKGIIKILTVGSRPELYFLFSLIIITSIAMLNHKYFGKRIFMQYILLGVSLLLIILAVNLTILTHNTIFSAYWNPICFLPYVFTASVLSSKYVKFSLPLTQTKSDILKRLPFWLMIITFVLLSWLEWLFLINSSESFNGYLLPPYARPSLIFGSTTVVWIAIDIQSLPPIFIQKLSQKSFPIYILHNYFLQIWRSLNIQIFANSLFGCIFAIVLSIFISEIITKNKILKSILNSG